MSSGTIASHRRAAARPAANRRLTARHRPATSSANDVPGRTGLRTPLGAPVLGDQEPDRPTGHGTGRSRHRRRTWFRGSPAAGQRSAASEQARRLGHVRATSRRSAADNHGRSPSPITASAQPRSVLHSSGEVNPRLAFTQPAVTGSVCRWVGPYWPELARFVLPGGTLDAEDTEAWFASGPAHPGGAAAPGAGLGGRHGRTGHRVATSRGHRPARRHLGRGHRRRSRRHLLRR